MFGMGTGVAIQVCSPEKSIVIGRSFRVIKNRVCLPSDAYPPITIILKMVAIRVVLYMVLLSG